MMRTSVRRKDISINMKEFNQDNSDSSSLKDFNRNITLGENNLHIKQHNTENPPKIDPIYDGGSQEQ